MRPKSLVIVLLAVGTILGGWFLFSPGGSGPRAGRRLHRDARPPLVEGPAASLILPSESLLLRYFGSAADGDDLLLRVFSPLPPGAEWTGESPKEMRVVGSSTGADTSSPPSKG